MLATLVRPRFWPGHLAMLVCVAIAVGLGAWQYDAWRLHRADAARDLADAPAKPLSEVMTGDDPFPGRSLGQPVSVSGSWLGRNIYVSERTMDGKAGYWVVTALAVDGTDSAMPIVRGWWPTTDLPTPTGEASVVGWLEATEGSGPLDEEPHDDVITTMRIASLVEKVDKDLYSGYVVAKSIPDQEGIPYVAPTTAGDVSWSTGVRNLFYGIEWWVFGAFALFIWVRWCQDSLRPPPDEDERQPGELEDAQA